MTIKERDMEMLAELKDMPAFVLLIQIMKNFEQDVLAEIAVIKTETELVRSTRFYQNLRCIREVLETKPQEAANVLTQMQFESMTDAEVGAVTDVYRRRLDPLPLFDNQVD